MWQCDNMSVCLECTKLQPRPQRLGCKCKIHFDAETPSWTLPKPNFISPFYLDANGVTVKAKEGTPIGAKGLLNGVEYTVVDSDMLSI